MNNVVQGNFPENTHMMIVESLSAIDLVKSNT